MKDVHRDCVRKYKILYVLMKLLTALLALLIATLTLANKNYITNELHISNPVMSLTLSIAAFVLFVIAILSVSLKLDKRIYIHEQAVLKYEKLIKELIYKKYEIKDQDMSSYKSFMYEITSKYHNIINNLPSEYFLKVNRTFCKKYKKLHNPEDLIKSPDSSNLLVFMPGYNV